jgi:hypothetical protein
MNESLLSLLIQIPLVAAFILYTLERDKRDNAARTQRAEGWRCFMTKQQQVWQDFIAAQNAVNIAGLSDVSCELLKVADRLDMLHQIIVRHNGVMREAVHAAQEDGEEGDVK